MIIQAFAFYLFAAITVVSAAMVVSSRNPVHSVLFLILAFFNSAGLFVLLGAEFLAMILVIVYVGAVAVLFLFVVMMLDVNIAQMRQGFLHYLPIGSLVGIVLLAELALIGGAWVLTPEIQASVAQPIPPIEEVTNTEALGRILYTDYVYLFQAAGLILLVAMIGAIVLTLRHREGVKRQSIDQQNAKTRAEAVSVVKVPSREGMKQ